MVFRPGKFIAAIVTQREDNRFGLGKVERSTIRSVICTRAQERSQDRICRFLPADLTLSAVAVKAIFSHHRAIGRFCLISA
jgi:hypothetical protein